MASIDFDRVDKTFEDGTAAVVGLDLHIPDGEFTVLVGPSGSGKSTALRMLAGLEEVTDGTIRIGDRDVTDLPPKDRDIAMVFQSYALYPHMDVASNMGFALKMQGISRPVIQERVELAARMLGLEGYLHKRPRHLSGGQRQRVALGRAIVREPQAFLMDEPLSNLDAKLRVEMRAYLQRLHQELGTTTLYVTHDQTEAMTMGDRVAVMREGRLEQVDRPQALYDRPANTFVASFIGSPAMNLVRARLEQTGERLEAVVGSHRLAFGDAILERRPELAQRVGRDVVLGIRPEAFEQSPNGAVSGRTLELAVLLTEALGSDLVAHLDLDAEAVLTGDQLEVAEDLGHEAGHTGVAAGHARITARLPPGALVRPGEMVRLLIDPERCHLFDADTGSAIR
jgi:multiple sugar transport system ATP-binding protein